MHCQPGNEAEQSWPARQARQRQTKTDCAREAGATKQRLARQDRAPLRPILNETSRARACPSAQAFAREVERPIARATADQQASQAVTEHCAE